MDPAPPPSGASTAITTAPLLGCPAVNAVVPPTPPRPAAPAFLEAWPRSAQWATAFLLGVAVALLAVNGFGYLRYGSRPTELERGAGLAYRVNLNHARRAELLQLPGVGDSMAERIEAYRQASGGFRTVEDLSNIRGVGPATLERLKPWVFVARQEADEEAQPPAAEMQPQALAARRAPPPKKSFITGGGQEQKGISAPGTADRH